MVLFVERCVELQFQYPPDLSQALPVEVVNDELMPKELLEEFKEVAAFEDFPFSDPYMSQEGQHATAPSSHSTAVRTSKVAPNWHSTVVETQPSTPDPCLSQDTLDTWISTDWNTFASIFWKIPVEILIEHTHTHSLNHMLRNCHLRQGWKQQDWFLNYALEMFCFCVEIILNVWLFGDGIVWKSK